MVGDSAGREKAEPGDFSVFGVRAGGTLADTLAQTGKRILMLERGTFLTREIENRASGPVLIDCR